MSVSPARFASAGQVTTHYIPGAYSRRNFVANEGGGVSSGNVCILGYSDLGEPGKLLVFENSNDARAELQGGEGLDGVIQAFNPGNDMVPQQIGFMRVNPGTQSQRALQKSSVDIFTMKSFSWGVPMNQLRLKFLAGTAAGTHKVLTEYKGTINITDNIEKKSFSLQYVGAGTAAAMTIGETTLTTSVTGGPGGEDLNITLADFPTISELVQYINNQTAYSATIITDVTTELSSVLDAVTAVDILTTAYTVKSDYQAVYDALSADTFIESVTKSGVNRVVPEYDSDYVYFTGATSGTYTTTDFTNALEALEEEDIQLVSTTSTDIAVHILIKDHCVLMSSTEGKRERQFYVGGAIGDDVSAVNTRSATLNSSLGSNCSPGFYNFNDAGIETLYAPSYYACKQVGMLSAMALNTPTTQKTVNILRWEKDYTRTEKNTLIAGGTLCGAKDQDGAYITVRSVTTYQGSNLQRNEASIMRETLYQDSDLRSRAQNAFIGTPNLGNAQLARFDAIFERAVKDWAGEGLINPTPAGPLYEGYTRRIVGDQIVVEYTTYNTAPTNFVFITHNVTVLGV